MPDAKPTTELPASATSSGTSHRSADPSTSTESRSRRPQRQSRQPNDTSPAEPRLDRRRSSLLSLSGLDDVRQSLTDDLLSSSTKNGDSSDEEDGVTNWHSTPLIFAVVPALIGLLIPNGAAFVTDALLLLLAAVFLNGSIILTWDWYYSAQTQRRAAELDTEIDATEELGTPETAVDSTSSGETSLENSAQDIQKQQEHEHAAKRTSLAKREAAAAELRQQEMLALLATFTFPILAAYLLHVIRGQLSFSTGLVSDFNITIFVLAAEIRPCRQLAKLVQSRTLHLQRTVTGLNDPFGSAVEEKAHMTRLTTRVLKLESALLSSSSDPSPNDLPLARKGDLADLAAEVKEIKKRYEARLEGLERAVRRYEKRSVTLTAVVEQRLHALEGRLQDALSLAAVAAKQSEPRGALVTLLDGASALVLWPVQIAWGLAMWPMHVAQNAYGSARDLLLGRTSPKPARRTATRHGGGKEERLKEKSAVRRAAAR